MIMTEATSNGVATEILYIPEWPVAIYPLEGYAHRKYNAGYVIITNRVHTFITRYAKRFAGVIIQPAEKQEYILEVRDTRNIAKAMYTHIDMEEDPLSCEIRRQEMRKNDINIGDISLTEIWLLHELFVNGGKIEVQGAFPYQESNPAFQWLEAQSLHPSINFGGGSPLDLKQARIYAKRTYETRECHPDALEYDCVEGIYHESGT